MFKFSAWWVGLSPKQAATAMLNPADEAADGVARDVGIQAAKQAAKEAAPDAAPDSVNGTVHGVVNGTVNETVRRVVNGTDNETVNGLADHAGSTPFKKAAWAPRASAATEATPLDLSELVGAEGWARLPAPVRRRFAAGHAATVYEGRMDLACSRVGRAYALLARLFGSPLTAARTQGLPTRVRVHNDGQGGVVWERCFTARDGMPAQTVRSTKLRDGRGHGLIERTDGGLAMNLDVFEDQGALVFQSRRYFFDLFGWHLPVPAWLTPGTCRVEHLDLGPGRFRFTLVMDHPRWGRCFEQTGVFIDPDGSVE